MAGPASAHTETRRSRRRGGRGRGNDARPPNEHDRTSEAADHDPGPPPLNQDDVRGARGPEPRAQVIPEHLLSGPPRRRAPPPPSSEPRRRGTPSSEPRRRGNAPARAPPARAAPTGSISTGLLGAPRLPRPPAAVLPHRAPPSADAEEIALNRAIAASCRENYASYAGDSDANLQAVPDASRRSAPRQVRHVSHDDDAQLAAALQASLRETTPTRSAMSEDKQLAAALQASLRENAPVVVTPPSSFEPPSPRAAEDGRNTRAAATMRECGDDAKKLERIAELSRLAIEQAPPETEVCSLLREIHALAAPRRDPLRVAWLDAAERRCAMCGLEVRRGDFSKSQWKRPVNPTCKRCVKFRVENQANPELQFDVPGAKHARNRRRQFAARWLPTRPTGERPGFSDPDVRALAARNGAEARLARRQAAAAAEAQSRSAATAVAAFLDD